MADPQKKAQSGASAVAECTATDCSHNEDKECHAGEIVVRMDGSSATCGTYDPETPKARP